MTHATKRNENGPNQVRVHGGITPAVQGLTVKISPPLAVFFPFAILKVSS